MLRETGSTRVMAEVGPPRSVGTGDSVLRAVLATVAGQYELLGELGRGVAGTIMFLARELDSSHLVVLRLDPAQSGDGSVLSVVRELDASIPGGATLCPECGATTVGWGRYCPACGVDLEKTGQVSSDATWDGESSATGEEPRIDDFDILGSVPRAGGMGAGVVHFARDLATGGIVALEARGGGRGGGNPDLNGFRVVQSLRPLTSPAAPSAASWYPESSGEHELPPAQPPRAQPTPHRAAPQEVLIPSEELTSPDDRLPPRPARRIPRWWIASAGVLAVAVVALAAFVKARVSQPDGTDARLGSGGMGIAPASIAPASAATPVARSDSSYIRISAQLPPNATVTIDGVALSAGSVALVPGEYEVAASAPGYVGVSERLTLEPGQTLVWMPTLAAAAREAAPAKPTSKKSVQPTKSSVVAEQAASAGTPAESPAQSCQRAFDAKEWALAATLCASEARNGGVAAQRNLGVMYDRGVGVPRDPATAAEWLRGAAEAGSSDAAYQLGAMYETGRGVEKDDARAVSWYRKAALLGDKESQVKVGKAYEQGLGVATDMGEALTWYRKAAGQGDAWAQNYIGFLYGNGKGVRHDDVEALRWFREAAASGNAQAEYNVGFMYANGRGVDRSEVEAVRWYREAASHGYEEAAKELERRGIKP